MAKQFLDIHMEGQGKNAEGLKRLLDVGIPGAISFIPQDLKKGRYGNEVIKAAMEIKNRGGIIGQHGNSHLCHYRDKHTIADPGHENYCLYRSISLEQQRELIGNGKEILMAELGISPELYVPPNHLYNDDTLKVAEEFNFKFFAERGFILTEPYQNQRGAVILLPEIKIPTKVPDKERIYYIHYGDLVENPKILKNLQELTKFEDIEPNTNTSLFQSKLNVGAVRGFKFARDALYELPKKISKKFTIFQIIR